LIGDIVQLAYCALEIFDLIPVVGPCIRDLVVGIVQYVLNMVAFLFHVAIGLLTLPYFLIAIPSIGNFVSQTNIALNYFVTIQQQIIADVPTSIKNCVCAILNSGFPVPPIPCSSCVVGGFIPDNTTTFEGDPLPPTRRRRVMFDTETGFVFFNNSSSFFLLWFFKKRIKSYCLKTFFFRNCNKSMAIDERSMDRSTKHTRK